MNTRQKKILQKLKRNGHVSIAKEAHAFAVNEMTIRRDLNILESIGEATRIHGGAIPQVSIPGGMDFLATSPRDAQIRIAQETIKHLEPNSTVMLNTGTTVLQVAREIATSEIPLTVITNSLPVAIVLYRSQCQVILTGGTLREKWVDLTGPLTQKNLDAYYVDILIAGCDGALPQEGFFTSDINLAEIEKKSVQISNKVIIVTESSKFGKKSFAKFATIDKVDIIISDKKLPKSTVDELSKQNIQVICR